MLGKAQIGGCIGFHPTIDKPSGKSVYLTLFLLTLVTLDLNKVSSHHIRPDKFVSP